MAFVPGDWVAVNQTTAGFQNATDLWVTPGGGFQVVWDTVAYGEPGAGLAHTTWYRIFDSAGAPVTGDIAAGSYNGDGAAPMYLQQSIQLDDGTTLKVNEVFDTYSPASTFVLQLYDQNGVPLGDPIPTGAGGGHAGLAQLPDRDIVFVEQLIGKTGPGEIFARVFHNTSPDLYPPVLTRIWSADGSAAVPTDGTVLVTFNELVQLAPGARIDLKTGTGELVASFDASHGTQLDVSSLRLTPPATLAPGGDYMLEFAPGSILDTSGNAFAGGDFHFTTAGVAPPPGSQDATAPAAIDFFPAAGSHTLPPDWNFGITFSEDVKAGAGTISLQTATGEVVQTFATANDPGIHFSGASLIINPAADLHPGTTYQLVVQPGAVVDLAGNAYAGESGYAFTTAGSPPSAPDTVAPVVVDYSPVPGSHTLALDGNISITFNEPVKAGPSSITLATAWGLTREAVQEFVAATDPGIHFVGSTLIIDPAADLHQGTQYEVIIYRDAVEDLAGNAYGIDIRAPVGPIESRYAFFTDGPILLGGFPSDKIPFDWNMGLTFNEAMKAGAGTITLQTGAGDVVQTFVTASDPGIQFSGANVIINPAADLHPGTTYQLIVSPDAVEDLSGIAFPGITSWTFHATASSDIVAPRAIQYFPAEGSTTIAPDSNFTVTFDEAVMAGSGTILLRTAGGQPVQTFTTATDAGIHFSGSSLVIDPVNNLQPGTDYAIFFGGDAVEDLAGNTAYITGSVFFTTGAS